MGAAFSEKLEAVRVVRHNVLGRLLSVVLFACAVLVVGLAVTGVLEQIRSRAPMAIVTR
jgi:hypothetical protein